MINKFNLRLVYWNKKGGVFHVRETIFWIMLKDFILANVFKRDGFGDSLNEYHVDIEGEEFSHATLEYIK